MPPIGGETGKQNTGINAQLWLWNQPKEILNNPQLLSGKPVLTDFTLNLEAINGILLIS